MAGIYAKPVYNLRTTSPSYWVTVPLEPGKTYRVLVSAPKDTEVIVELWNPSDNRESEFFRTRIGIGSYVDIVVGVSDEFPGLKIGEMDRSGQGGIVDIAIFEIGVVEDGANS